MAADYSTYADRGFTPPGNQAAGGPYPHAVAVTPDDAVDLPATTRALWVGGTGDVTVQMAGSEDPVLIANVADGTLLQLCVTRVLDTGTDATGIIALW